ncbi:hypothetical protein D3C87_1934620 [compost metagenome]
MAHYRKEHFFGLTQLQRLLFGLQHFPLNLLALGNVCDQIYLPFQLSFRIGDRRIGNRQPNGGAILFFCLNFYGIRLFIL